MSIYYVPATVLDNAICEPDRHALCLRNLLSKGRRCEGCLHGFGRLGCRPLVSANIVILGWKDPALPLACAQHGGCLGFFLSLSLCPSPLEWLHVHMHALSNNEYIFFKERKALTNKLLQYSTTSTDRVSAGFSESTRNSRSGLNREIFLGDLMSKGLKAADGLVSLVGRA